MNTIEKRRAEQMIKEAFDEREGRRPMARKPQPPATLVKKVAELTRAIEQLLADAHFHRDYRGELTALETHPAVVKEKAEREARRNALHDERDEWIRRVWADELTWDDIKKVQSQK